MSIVYEGKVTTLIIFCFYFVTALVYYILLRQEKITLEVRRIPQLDSIADGIDRCLEMGKPLMYYTSYAYFSTTRAPDAIASIDILENVAKQVAQKDIEMHASPITSQLYPHFVETVREAYMSVGKLSSFSMDIVKYYASSMIAWIAAHYSFLKERQPACILAMGAIYDSIYYFTGYAALHNIDNISIAGSGPVSSVAYIIIGADEWLIGDEYFAAAIAMGGKKESSGSIITSDLWKFIASGILIVGAIAGALGVDTVINLLTL